MQFSVKLVDGSSYTQFDAKGRKVMAEQLRVRGCSPLIKSLFYDLPALPGREYGGKPRIQS